MYRGWHPRLRGSDVRDFAEVAVDLATMNPRRSIGLVALVAAMFGCDIAPKVPGVQEKGYPPIIADSADRREKAERDWRRLLDTYNLSPTPPDLYPITYTLKSLLGVPGGIKFVTLQAAVESPNLALREAAKGFIERWRDLIGVDPAGISLVGATATGNVTQFTYRQGNYPFPLGGDYGEMTLSISRDGRLTQIDDRFIPVVELPIRPAIDKEAAIKKLIGKSFTLSDKSGRQQQVSISSAADVTACQIVVLAIQKSNGLEVHLAWQFNASKAQQGWGIYIDAVNGQELRLADNSQP